MAEKKANINTNFFSQIVDLLQFARGNVVRTINQTMVTTYFEIGRMIVEEEQGGKERAEYGKQLLKELSKVLTKEFGRGFSVENLTKMRYFYLTYSNSSTLLTISPKSRHCLKISKNNRHCLQNSI